jgi:hypothetical protein
VRDNSFASSYTQFTQTRIGQNFHRGVKEAFGWSYGAGNQDYGFMGRNDPALKQKLAKANSFGAKAFTRVSHAASSGFGLLYTAGMAYSGYQEGGVWGAAKNTAQAGIENALFNVGLRAIGNPVTLGLAATAAIGYGVYRYGKAAGKYGKGIKKVEMGAPFVDTFGTAATIRQRSLSALQNSHVNGRMAMGSEAALMHSPMMR